MIFSPLDLVFFQQIFPKKVRVQSWQHIHIQQQIRQKSPKTPPKKLESSPTTHVTETRFLHILDPPDHFGTIYIFDDFFTIGLFLVSLSYYVVLPEFGIFYLEMIPIPIPIPTARILLKKSLENLKNEIFS